MQHFSSPNVFLQKISLPLYTPTRVSSKARVSLNLLTGCDQGWTQ